jgi:hypothetical protein
LNHDNSFRNIPVTDSANGDNIDNDAANNDIENFDEETNVIDEENNKVTDSKNISFCTDDTQGTV